MSSLLVFNTELIQSVMLVFSTQLCELLVFLSLLSFENFKKNSVTFPFTGNWNKQNIAHLLKQGSIGSSQKSFRGFWDNFSFAAYSYKYLSIEKYWPWQNFRGFRPRK
jgi:hypothetical protein